MVLSVTVTLVNLSVAIMQVIFFVVVLQLQVSAALIQVKVSVANMWVIIFIVIMQVGVSVAILQVIFSAVHYAHNCFYHNYEGDTLCCSYIVDSFK